MVRVLTCKICGETEMEYAKTGASIDNKYHCQSCYDKAMNIMEDTTIKEVFPNLPVSGSAYYLSKIVRDTK